MSEHLSDRQIGLYRSRTLSADELQAIDAHLAECEACAQRLMSPAERTAALESVLDYCAPQAAHLSYEQLERYTDGTLDAEARRAVEVHVKRCERCRGDLDGLRAFAVDLAADPEASSSQRFPAGRLKSRLGEAQSPPPGTRPSNPVRLGERGHRWAFSPMAIGAAAAALLVVAFISTISLRHQTSKLAADLRRYENENKQRVAEARNLQMQHDRALRKAEEAERDKAKANRQAQIFKNQNTTLAQTNADLKRKNHKLLAAAANKDSSLLGPLKSDERQAIAQPMRPDKMPMQISELPHDQNMLTARGLEPTFGPTSPDRTAVLSVRPTLRWNPRQGTAGYAVTVTDYVTGKVAAQTSGKITGTAWRVDRPLKRGGVYAWQVVPYTDLSSPEPRPPSRKVYFRVQDLPTADRDLNVQFKLAALYRHEGRLDDAEAALNEVVEDGSDLPVGRQAQQLLESLRKQREGENLP